MTSGLRAFRRHILVRRFHEVVIGLQGDTGVTFDDSASVLNALVDDTRPWAGTRRKYCFQCHATTRHAYCGNCGAFFCLVQADIETDYGEAGSVLAQYPVHNACAA